MIKFTETWKKHFENNFFFSVEDLGLSATETKTQWNIKLYELWYISEMF